LKTEEREVELYNRIDPREERKLKRGFHSMSLIETFLLEVSFPQVEIGWATFKNESIS